LIADYWTGYTMKGGVLLGPEELVKDVVIGGTNDELIGFPSSKVNLMSAYRGPKSLCVFLDASGDMNYLTGCADKELRMLCHKSL